MEPAKLVSFSVSVSRSLLQRKMRTKFEPQVGFLGIIVVCSCTGTMGQPINGFLFRVETPPHVVFHQWVREHLWDRLSTSCSFLSPHGVRRPLLAITHTHTQT